MMHIAVFIIVIAAALEGLLIAYALERNRYG